LEIRKKIMNIDLRQGDCLEVLKTIPDNSVDSVVVDPPYHLTSIVKRFGKEDSAPAQFGTDGAYARASKGFMGKEWDGGDIAFRTEVWSECLRVLKPGGHLLSFSHSRTYHRMAVAIEDAGFEIRDSIMWIYGSGFPKSHNIGKAIDKIQGNEREVVDVKEQSGAKFKNWSDDPNETRWHNQGFNKLDGRTFDLTRGQSEWEGWGTALKPAHEPICMARKPLSEKSIAENVLKWGTGGINIDGCRIEFENTPNAATNPKFRKENNYKMPEPGQESNESVKFTSSKNEYDTSGRFPANIILDEEAGKLLDEQSDKASRFFYCPKTSKKERDMNMTGDDKPTRKWRDDKGMKLTGSGNPRNETGKNTHPTVKPIKLMEYLIKLVTPKGGVVMDCFMGSGSTGIAAKNLGFSFIGIEREQEYFDIAQQRIGL